MLQHLRTFGIVSVITLLVWVFAEGESLGTTSVTLEVRLVSDAPNLIVDLGEGESWNGTVEVRLEGPTARLDEVRALLRRPEAIELTTRELGTQSGAVRLAEVLRRHPVFRGSGVTIVDTDPKVVRIEVIRLVEREAKVVVDPDGVALRGLAQAEPSTLVIKMPEDLSEQTPDPLELVVRLRGEMVQGLTPGQAQTIFNIPVELPESLREHADRILGLKPVNVRLTLAVRTETRSLASVPVDLRIPAVVSDRYLARVSQQEQLLTGVQIRGPVEVLDQVGAGKRYTPRIEVFLTPEELSSKVPADGSEVELVVQGRLIGVPPSVEPAEAPPAVHVFVRRADVEADQEEPGE